MTAGPAGARRRRRLSRPRRRGGWGRRLGLGALPTLAVLALWIVAGSQPPLITAELASLDLRFQIRGPLPPGDDVALVLIDDRTIEAAGSWPLPRDVLARAVGELDRLGAAVIAFDLLLPERVGAPAAAAAADAALARAIAEAPGVLVPFAFVWNRAEAGVTTLPPGVARAAYRVVMGSGAGGEARRPGPAALPPPAAGAVVPAPAILDAATTTGHVSVLLAPDGALRIDRLALSDGRDLYPSLTVEAVRLFDGLRREDVVVRAGEGVAIGPRFVPTDGGLGLPVNYYGPRATFPAWSMADLLAGRLPDSAVRGRIVVIGASAVGLGDTFDTAYTRTLPGAEHFATAIDNVLTGRMLDRGAGPRASDLVGIVAVGGVTALAWLLPPALAAAIGVLAILGWAGLAQAAFVLGPTWIGVAGPTLAGLVNIAVLGLAAAIAERHRAEEVERRRRALARYLPDAVAERLAAGTGPPPPRSTTATVMFVDLIGFTPMAETLPAAEALDLIRVFHGRVERAVLDQGGMVDKYIGDGALAAFGAIDPDPAAPAAALASARALAADVARWSAEREAAGLPGLAIGLGVHTGTVLVGDVGGAQQPQFTVIGDTVNVASRLEGLTRTLGCTIVASDTTIDAARAAGGLAAVAGFERHGSETLRGRAAPVGVWVMGGSEPAPDSPARDA